jgi:hypothetical protein
MESSSNTFFWNNFITPVPVNMGGSVNIWDKGYPSGGNYWSGYTGTDVNHDGIGDTPYVIDESSIDNYPLMNPWVEQKNVYLVVRGSNKNQIWHGTVDVGTRSFSGWRLLDGATPSQPTLTTNGTHLCLVVRGNNNVIYYRWYDLSSETWGSWTGFPYGSTPDVPAATIVGDSLQIVVRGMNNNQIWHGTLDLTSDEWSGWTLLDGTTPSKPVLTN